MPRRVAQLLRASSLIPLMAVAICMSAALHGSRWPAGKTTAVDTRVCALRTGWDLRVTVERFEVVSWDSFKNEAGSVLVFGVWRPTVTLSLWPWFIGALLLPVLAGGVRFGRAAPAAGAFPVLLPRADADDPEKSVARP